MNKAQSKSKEGEQENGMQQNLREIDNLGRRLGNNNGLMPCALLSLGLFVISLSIQYSWLFLKYWEISARIANGDEDVESEELVNILNRIIECSFYPRKEEYYEEFVLELARMSQWGLLIKHATDALSYPSNQNIFSIHYHKGLAHCMLEQYSLCHEEVQIAEEIVRVKGLPHKQSFIDELYKLLKEYKAAPDTRAPLKINKAEVEPEPDLQTL